GILRCDIGIKVPEKKTTYIRVMNEYQTWQVGKSNVLVAFYDLEVYNDSDDIRVILMIDFMRPMPMIAPLHLINLLCLKMKKKWGTTMIDRANNS
ncbi:aspartyl/asparaginyl beta-hydroxylase domain-containing protein, partial [Photorhabdus sp. CRCIA-P01]|uniref:aspartyl/asparaginyl beta-hydroxylase domain-containing protein n=1 Tax=Photorhabdus sp. CRCIA-P01 TaxID=2019570 RepID=UPI0018E4EDF1